MIVTKGTLDNVRRLAEGGNAVAFAPSTVDWSSGAGVDAPHLVALGSVGFEPLWLFYRSDLEIARIPDLSGRKVVTEGTGTTSDYAGRMLIEKNGLAGEVELQPLAGQTAKALVQGFAARTIDAGFVTGDVNSPVVASMLNADGAKFLSFDRAEAYAGLIPGVTALLAPEGVFDLVRNVPPQDAQLLAATTCLIAHESLNPAVVPMLLVAAENVRQKRTTFSTTVTFPNTEHVTLPVHSAARRYFNQGEIGLSKFLPYKVTRFLNHLGFFVLPVLAVAVMVLKFVPVGLRIWGGFRLKGLFKQLEAVEKGQAAGDDLSKLVADLDRIDRASAAMFVPRSTVHDYIDFRQFLHDMRERVEKQDGTGP